MTQWHLKSKRKSSGGLRTSRKRSDKKRAWKGGEFAATQIVKEEKEVKKRKIRKRGGTIKYKLQKVLYANVTDPKTQKTSKLKIINVKENVANKEFARRNIITKNAVIEVEGNKQAKVTSRPGQSGTVSAVLLEE